MSIEINAIRTADVRLAPATGEDASAMQKLKIGQPVKIKITRRKQRSDGMNRLYWGGLLELAMQYWEPKGGLVSDAEENIIHQFARWLDNQAGGNGALINASRTYINELTNHRACRIETPEKSKQQLHRWVKEQCGYYDLVQTPSGIRKEVKSISFDSMSQEEFNEYYKQAFGVIWRFVLSQTFDNEQAAQDAINQLITMG